PRQRLTDNDEFERRVAIGPERLIAVQRIPIHRRPIEAGHRTRREDIIGEDALRCVAEVNRFGGKLHDALIDEPQHGIDFGSVLEAAHADVRVWHGYPAFPCSSSPPLTPFPSVSLRQAASFVRSLPSV